MQTKVRVAGSGFTTFNYRGVPIAFLDGFTDRGQEAVGGGGQPYEAITPLGDYYPREIATTRVLGPGQLDISIRELWNGPVWWSLGDSSGNGNGPLRGTRTITEVFMAFAADPNEVSCSMIITPPSGTGLPPRGKTYHGCVITDIDDREQVTIGALSVPRVITLIYTNITRF